MQTCTYMSIAKQKVMPMAFVTTIDIPRIKATSRYTSHRTKTKPDKNAKLTQNMGSQYNPNKPEDIGKSRIMERERKRESRRKTRHKALIFQKNWGFLKADYWTQASSEKARHWLETNQWGRIRSLLWSGKDAASHRTVLNHFLTTVLPSSQTQKGFFFFLFFFVLCLNQRNLLIFSEILNSDEGDVMTNKFVHDK